MQLHSKIPKSNNTHDLILEITITLKLWIKMILQPSNYKTQQLMIRKSLIQKTLTKILMIAKTKSATSQSTSQWSSCKKKGTTALTWKSKSLYKLKNKCLATKIGSKRTNIKVIATSWNKRSLRFASYSSRYSFYPDKLTEIWATHKTTPMSSHSL